MDIHQGKSLFGQCIVYQEQQEQLTLLPLMKLFRKWWQRSTTKRTQLLPVQPLLQTCQMHAVVTRRLHRSISLLAQAYTAFYLVYLLAFHIFTFLPFSLESKSYSPYITLFVGLATMHIQLFIHPFLCNIITILYPQLFIQHYLQQKHAKDHYVGPHTVLTGRQSHQIVYRVRVHYIARDHLAVHNYHQKALVPYSAIHTIGNYGRYPQSKIRQVQSVMSIVTNPGTQQQVCKEDYYIIEQINTIRSRMQAEVYVFIRAQVARQAIETYWQSAGILKLDISARNATAWSEFGDMPRLVSASMVITMEKQRLYPMHTMTLVYGIYQVRMQPIPV
eukprot:TRINITY_DN88257_c0_g1_i1.p1 TRINITY_DN88257_c0_g1~~TRINITY_DN88257_c0_g1_i1.p1  ORF type:complete len:359 (+),score=-40.07 TRINITY_DN88257_c0_g1_i1:80-1078(+)